MEEGKKYGSKKARTRPVEEREVLGSSQGIVSSEAGTAGACQIMQCFICRAQKLILKATKSSKP